MDSFTALNILEEIKKNLYVNDNGISALKTINIYKKNLYLATNKDLERLINKRLVYLNKYGENNFKTIRLTKKIEKIIHKIFNNM